jgi:hypothetical protein
VDIIIMLQELSLEFGYINIGGALRFAGLA